MARRKALPQVLIRYLPRNAAVDPTYLSTLKRTGRHGKIDMDVYKRRTSEPTMARIDALPKRDRRQVWHVGWPRFQAGWRIRPEDIVPRHRLSRAEERREELGRRLSQRLGIHQVVVTERPQNTPLTLEDLGL